MAQIVNGLEPKFHVQRMISNAGGWDRYHNTLKQAGEVLAIACEPLDTWNPDDNARVERQRKRQRKRKGEPLTGIEFRDARGKLGKMWGLNRPLTLTEFGRVLRLGGVRPDQSVRDYERGKTQVSGPMSLLIELLLAGAKPEGLDSILSRG